MAGMYPDNREESIFGEHVEWPGVDPATGKFTNGDFSDPLKKPSFIPAETINLILDNLAGLITALGGTPDNFSVDQLRDAVLGGIGASAFIPAATATARGGARVPGGNGLAMSGDALGMSLATPQAAGAMSVQDKLRLDAQHDNAFTGVAAPADGNAQVALSRAGSGGDVSLPNALGGNDAARRAGMMSGQDKQRLDATDPRANEYTFIIDSNAALAAWANDTAGNDYSRVLIKAGTWTLSAAFVGGTIDDPVAAIDISNGRTMSVVGEAGSRIVINRTGTGALHLAGVKGRVTGVAPNLVSPGGEFFLKNVDIRLGSIGSASTGRAFVNCANLTNCTGTAPNAATGGGGNNSCGFANCINLTGCTGFGGNNGGLSANNRHGFLHCTNLTNCIGTSSTASGGAVNSSSSGFARCTNLINCIGRVGSLHAQNHGFFQCRTGFGNRRGADTFTSGTFRNCLMAQGPEPPSSNDWANTAEGGWNDPSNPGASSLSATPDVPPDAQGAFSADAETSGQDAKSEDINAITPRPEKEAPANGRGLP